MSILNAICTLSSRTKCFRRDYSSYEYTSIVQSTRKGLICNYKQKYFLISAAHDLNDNSEDFLIIEGNNYPLDNNKKILVSEIDLVIYEIDYIFNHSFNLSLNKFTINDINDKTPLYLYDEDDNVKNTRILFMQKERYNNFCYPKMLKYFGELTFDYVIGCSGTPIFDNSGNIYGILSGFNNYLNITPMFFVKRILDEYTLFGKFNGLCSFWHDVQVIKRNLIINKREDIDYNIYQKLLFIDKNIGKLAKGDIILKLDNKNITNGLIFCDLLNMEIDIDSYISVTKTIHNINQFNIFRPKNVRVRNLKVITGNRDIYSGYNIDLKEDFLVTKEVDNKIFMKVNPILFRYISNFRPVHVDNKLMNIFKLKEAETFDNEYLLVEDKSLKKNIFNEIQKNYILTK